MDIWFFSLSVWCILSRFFFGSKGGFLVAQTSVCGAFLGKREIKTTQAEALCYSIRAGPATVPGRNGSGLAAMNNMSCENLHY